MNRGDVLNHLIKRWGLRSYLELGTQVRANNFDKIKCDWKFCVDLDYGAKADFTGTTDEFFRQYGNELRPVANGIDLIFIDASHIADQVQKDFENSLEILSRKGFIVLHDCSPAKEEYTFVPRPFPRGHWNGDVWRFAAAFYGYEDLIRYTVDIDNGCMVIQPGGGVFKTNISQMPWKEFDTNRKKYLNLISWQEFVSL